jgi:hypothetical protein
LVGLAALAIAPASAHRRDEYLQASRIGVDPARVQIELDLTPGIAVAPGIVRHIDLNRNGVFDVDEVRAYSERVRREIRLDLDGRRLPLALIDRRFPPLSAIFKGEGTIQLQLAADVPPLTAGSHRLRYRNDHRADIGAYLANPLVPATDRVAVLAQRRDVDQRELVIEYALRDGSEKPVRW